MDESAEAEEGNLSWHFLKVFRVICSVELFWSWYDYEFLSLLNFDTRSDMFTEEEVIEEGDEEEGLPLYVIIIAL